jgi:hypothetical protein
MEAMESMSAVDAFCSRESQGKTRANDVLAQGAETPRPEGMSLETVRERGAVKDLEFMEEQHEKSGCGMTGREPATLSCPDGCGRARVRENVAVEVARVRPDYVRCGRGSQGERRPGVIEIE